MSIFNIGVISEASTSDRHGEGGLVQATRDGLEMNTFHSETSYLMGDGSASSRAGRGSRHRQHPSLSPGARGTGAESVCCRSACSSPAECSSFANACCRGHLPLRAMIGPGSSPAPETECTDLRLETPAAAHQGPSHQGSAPQLSASRRVNLAQNEMFEALTRSPYPRPLLSFRSLSSSPSNLSLFASLYAVGSSSDVLGVAGAL